MRVIVVVAVRVSVKASCIVCGFLSGGEFVAGHFDVNLFNLRGD